MAGRRLTDSTAEFTHNPHVALPTTLADFQAPFPQIPASTFPYPLPPFLPRSVPIPPARPPPSIPSTSSAGLFSLSLRGVRRTLRARPSSASLVIPIESHIAAWLHGGTYLNPDQAKGLLHFPGEPVAGRHDIREVGREAARLVWIVNPDHDAAFERYVVHCVARWYGIVSFSKESDGHRLTYLLRPNITRPDPAASQSLDTPPMTDLSDASLSDDNPTDTSDVDSIQGDPPTALFDIEESNPLRSDSDNDADDRGFAASMESLSLSAPPSVADTTFVTRGEQGEDSMLTPSDRLRMLHPRSASPARRSPHRLPTRKVVARRKRKAKNGQSFPAVVGINKGSFHDYLFA